MEEQLTINTRDEVGGEAQSQNSKLRASTKARRQHDKAMAMAIRPGYLRPAAAAKYMGVTVRTLSNWVKARMVAQIKPSNRVCLFRISDLDAALNRFRIRAFGEG
jgi:DNA-binding transcriptional regulator YiaG